MPRPIKPDSACPRYDYFRARYLAKKAERGHKPEPEQIPDGKKIDRMFELIEIMEREKRLAGRR